MKNSRCHAFLIIIFCFTVLTICAQNPAEQEIRNLENSERESVLKNDTVSLFNKYWSPTMKINTPGNTVGDLKSLKKRMQMEKLNYASFERIIEDVSFDENIAIVMGYETLVPQGSSDHVGKQITRRFTNIWKNANGFWKIIARQSTIINIK